VDMFDCVMPSRNARNGMLFTRNGIINIKNRKWRDDHSPLDPGGTSFVDHAYSKAYLRHLLLSKELLGPMIATLHNLSFYVELMEEARQKIEEKGLRSWAEDLAPRLMERR
jgi:queuine tRNA-ribosyltransferase